MSDFEIEYGDNGGSFTLEDGSVDPRNEDYRYDNDDDQYYSDDASESSQSYSVITKKKKSTKKVEDKGYRKMKTKNGNLIYFATTMTPGAPIRDAIYGHRFYEYLVGSPNEELFFKVSNAGNNSSQNVDTLFYDNPEQFESHMNCYVDTESKNRWAEKYQYALERNKQWEDYKHQQQQEYTVVK